MTRGFVTIATGAELYYQVAANLLQSYRYHCADPMPFALICDRENEYTGGFDEVVVIDDAKRSYVDKLALPHHIPFDEAIFIDADCLAYADLNGLWEAFRDCSAFSVLGRVFSTRYESAWFKKEDVGEFGDVISYIPEFYGGVYYLRKSPELEEFSETCQFILDHYYDYKFRFFTDPADEPIVALSMAVHGFRPVDDKPFPVCYYPHTVHFEVDIANGSVSFDHTSQPARGVRDHAYLVHWGSQSIGGSAYRSQVRQLKAAVEQSFLGASK